MDLIIKQVEADLIFLRDTLKMSKTHISKIIKMSVYHYEIISNEGLGSLQLKKIVEIHQNTTAFIKNVKKYVDNRIN